MNILLSFCACKAPQVIIAEYISSFFLQFIKQYDTEDLMDIVLPRLAKVVTLWEFLMMKVESSNTNKPNLQNMYQEFESLTERVKDLFKKCLKFSDISDNTAQNKASNLENISEQKVKVMRFPLFR